MNKATFINLAKILALSSVFAALTYFFFCMCAHEWINIFSDSKDGVALRVCMVVMLHCSFCASVLAGFLGD